MSGGKAKPGKTLGNGPPEGQPWIWTTTAMFGSITFRALSINARRILDFLQNEHALNAGKANGSLGATYRQLAVWGVTAADARKGFEELYVTGFVRLTAQGMRQAGGGEPSRYALTWLPTGVGTREAAPPSHDWQLVLRRIGKEGVGSVAQAKCWLKAEVAGVKRGWTVRARPDTTSQLQVVSPLKCERSKAREAA